MEITVNKNRLKIATGLLLLITSITLMIASFVYLKQQKKTILNETRTYDHTDYPIYMGPTSYNTKIASTFVNPLHRCNDFIVIRGFNEFHPGVDLTAALGLGGEPSCVVSSAGDGIVVTAKWGQKGEGYYLVIDHGNNLFTKYYHGSGVFYVKEGDSVTSGQKIMDMGCTGFCTGTHLHFELTVGELRTNPEEFINLN